MEEAGSEEKQSKTELQGMYNFLKKPGYK